MNIEYKGDQTLTEENRPGEHISSGRGSAAPKSTGKKKRRGLVLILSILLIVALIAVPVAGVAGYLIGMQKGVLSIEESAKGTGVDNQAIIKKLETLEGLVGDYFLFDTDSEKLENGVYSGFLRGLDDKYAEYYTEEDYKKMMEEDSGRYQGIGVTVMKDTATNYVVIEGVFRNTPAEEAGLTPGDYIISVNKKETVDMTLSEVVSEIRRDDREDADLKIFRNGEEIDMNIVKSTVEVIPVEYRMLDDKIGYIEVDQFIEPTDDLFIEGVDALTDQGMKGLIIDLRENGGGLVTSCVNMLSRIVPEGKLLTYTEGKGGVRMDTYNSTSSETVDVPIVLLVNNNSASASEIFTGCLRDYGLAEVIGTKTYGKGIVQTVIPLSDGSAVKFPISKYYTPKGQNIHEVGFEPDIKVEMTDEEKKEARVDSSKDKQLNRAIKELKKK